MNYRTTTNTSAASSVPQPIAGLEVYVASGQHYAFTAYIALGEGSDDGVLSWSVLPDSSLRWVLAGSSVAMGDADSVVIPAGGVAVVHGWITGEANGIFQPLIANNGAGEASTAMSYMLVEELP